MTTFAAGTVARGPYPQARSSMQATQGPPPGTFVPGTKVQCGQHRVVIDRYLSEGGFAHVYVVTLPTAIKGESKAVLKRVAVPDKEHLANMRTEVDTMKRLRGHKQIVKYIDSHASPLKVGGFEVFLLMEFCQGGGLIDFMNTRLQNRLTEPEILKIFTDVAEGVACMHYLKPPLLHRDLKVENVLISSQGKDRMFKLCDFGSAAPPRPAATSAAEGRLIEDDVQRHTTLQYRSPEMIDVYRKQPIDEKSDIWALGVFLYKLCYYTTPFEEVGQMAILNASFKFPGYPRFSDQLKLLIASMLREQPSERPNIYQVLGKACKMDGRELPVRDIYKERTKSETRQHEKLPQLDSSQSRVGATLSPPKQEKVASVPDIAPMRRGRPSQPVSHHNSAKPSPSPLRMMEDPDPFAQLDEHKAGSADEISHRFPSLDQFSLMTDAESKFAFTQSKQASVGDDTLASKVTAALADEAFGRTSSPSRKKPQLASKPESSKPSITHNQEQPIRRQNPGSKPPPPVTTMKKPSMNSTGTITSPTTTTVPIPPFMQKPIHRFPPKDAVSSPSVQPPRPSTSRPPIKTSKSGSRLANLLKDDAARSQGSDHRSLLTNSARPSMEGGRPSMRDLNIGIIRSRSLNMRARPVSVNIGAGATHIQDEEIEKPEFDNTLSLPYQAGHDSEAVESETNITSDVDFLKAKEEEERERTKHFSRHHSKRTSLPAIAMSGTKNLLVGRFGEAFKRFESHGDRNGSHAIEESDHVSGLTPIAGSEATDLSEDRGGFDETEELSPEVRRELEKRTLEAEERRVAEAAAQYRQRVSNRSGPPPMSTKAASIQNRVQSLLQDSGRPVQKTAAGYGQYTNTATSITPPVPQKSATFQTASGSPVIQPMRSALQDIRPTSAPPSATNLQRIQKPAAPPKPKMLQKTNNGTPTQPEQNDFSSTNNEAVMTNDDWESQFSKKYPSLSHFEMVETEIGSSTTGQFRTKEI